MANRFDVVSVWTDDERCVVVSAVLRTQTRRAIVIAASLQSRTIEGLDLLATLGCECQMKMRRGLGGLIQAK